MLNEKIVKAHQNRLKELIHKHFLPLSTESYSKLKDFTDTYLQETERFFLKIHQTHEKQIYINAFPPLHWI